MKLKYLSKMAVFAAVAKAGSFTRAGEALNINKSAVSEHVSALEQYLGTKLFQRTTRSLNLTEAGQIYLHYCNNMLNTVNEAKSHLKELNTQPTGRMRITTTNDFGSTVLIPLLNEFRQTYPDIQFDLLFDMNARNLIEDQIDLALRFGQPADSSLVARKLGNMSRWVCATPQLFGSDIPQTLEALTQYDWILRARTQRTWLVTSQQGQTEQLTVHAKHQCNTSEGMHEMVLSGFGIGGLPAFIAKPLIKQQRLVRLLPEHTLDQLEIFATFPSRDYLPNKTRLLVDFLAQQLAEHTN